VATRTIRSIDCAELIASDAVLRPRGPSPKGPPILIGARRPRMLRLVARYADAWNTAWHTKPEVVAERWAGMRQACEEEGRGGDFGSKQAVLDQRNRRN